MLRLSAAFLALLLILVPPSTAAPQTNADLLGSIQPSLVLVQATNPLNSDEVNTCTGFVVTFDRALTAEHCVEDGWTLLVDGAPSEVVKKDDMFALVSIPPGIKPLAPLASRMPALGDTTVGVGYGLGVLTIVERTVASRSGGDIAFDGLFTPGQSGGPVLNRDGQVIGLVQMNIPMPIPTLGVACGIQEIKDFLGR